MAGQREQIGQQLRGLYQAGAQSQLRLLLNQRDAESIARNLQYYEYLFAARREKMRGYLDAIQHLNDVQKKLAESTASLQNAQTQLEQEHANLVGKRDQRKQLLAAADVELQSKGGALAQLERDRTSLQKIVDQIEQQRALAEAKELQRQQREQQQAREVEQKAQEQKTVEQKPEAQKPETSVEEQAPALAEKPSAAYSAQDLAKLQSKSFSQAKGSLLWPVSGKLLNSFGETRKGGVSWDGIRIRAQAGSEVRAVHYGRVMYADWLRGQGLLMILDHGDGFMSLYAHNDVLLHEPGEWVQAGEAIARVGNSGGEQEPGLYFEIRKAGAPQNPKAWLAKH